MNEAARKSVIHRDFVFDQIDFLFFTVSGLSKIPTLDEILSTQPFPRNVEENFDHQILSRDSSNAMVNHLVRYSNTVSAEFESKPITEKMDHWYLDMKKNLMVRFQKGKTTFFNDQFYFRFRTNLKN